MAKSAWVQSGLATSTRCEANTCTAAVTETRLTEPRVRVRERARQRSRGPARIQPARRAGLVDGDGRRRAGRRRTRPAPRLGPVGEGEPADGYDGDHHPEHHELGRDRHRALLDGTEREGLTGPSAAREAHGPHGSRPRRVAGSLPKVGYSRPAARRVRSRLRTIGREPGSNPSRSLTLGGVPERTNGTVLKTVEAQVSEGSNPSPSAGQSAPTCGAAGVGYKSIMRGPSHS